MLKGAKQMSLEEYDAKAFKGFPKRMCSNFRIPAVRAFQISGVEANDFSGSCLNLQFLVVAPMIADFRETQNLDLWDPGAT